MGTFARCISAYSPDTIAQYSETIWDALKFEVLNGENEDFIEGSVAAIREVAYVLGNQLKDWNKHTGFLAEYSRVVLNDCKERLADKKHLVLWPCLRIAAAVGETSAFAFCRVTNVILPTAIALYEGLDVSQKTPFFNGFNLLMLARLRATEQSFAARRKARGDEEEEFVTSMDVEDVKMERDFAFYQHTIARLYFGAILEHEQLPAASSNYRRILIRGFALLYAVPNFLTDFEKGTLVEKLNAIALSTQSNLDMAGHLNVHMEALIALREISVQEPRTFHEITLVNFMARLPESYYWPDNPNYVEDIQDNYGRLAGILEDIGEIACGCNVNPEYGDTDTDMLSRHKFEIFESFQKALWAKIWNPDDMCILKSSGQMMYATTILVAMWHGLVDFEKDSTIELSRSVLSAMGKNELYHPYESFVINLYDLCTVFRVDEETNVCLVGVSDVGPEQEIFTDKFLDWAGKFAMVALRSRFTTSKNNFVLREEASHPNLPCIIWTLFRTEPEVETIDLMLKEARLWPRQKWSANILSMYLLAGLRPEVSTNKLR